MDTRNSFVGPVGAMVTLVGTLSVVGPAWAGPPLVCHPVEIGSAKSLPWSGEGGFERDKSYDAKRLVDDVLDLLKPETEVIVRMETLRRATIYARENGAVASKLLSAVQARVLDAEARGQSNGLYWFDAGYLTQCYAQDDMLSEWRGDGPAGYAWARKGSELRGSDAEMDFALALMTVHSKSPGKDWSKGSSHDEHLRKAVAGATEGSLLAKNLLTHLGDGHKTLADMKKQVARR